MTQLKPTTTLDVEVLLSPIVGGAKKLTSYVEIYEEHEKLSCLVKPKRFIPHTVWLLIHKKVREMNGRWSSKERLWLVPLDRRR